MGRGGFPSGLPVLRRCWLLLACFIFLPGRAQAASSGGEPFNFLFLDGNARAAALGGAYTALAMDANALHYNPAGLAFTRRYEATFMHNAYFQGISQEYGGLATPWGLGANFNYLSFSDVTRTTLAEPGGTLGKTGLDDFAGSAGYGRVVGGGLGLGVGLKYIRETIDDVTANAFAADLGALWEVPGAKGLSLGLSAQNIGPAVRFQGGFGKEKLPLTVRAGAAYVFKLGASANTVTVEGVKERSDRTVAGVGVESVVLEMFALRVGMNSRNDADVWITGGAGFLLKDLSLDYALVPFGELGLTHRASVTFRWGGAGVGGAGGEGDGRQAGRKSRRAKAVELDLEGAGGTEGGGAGGMVAGGGGAGGAGAGKKGEAAASPEAYFAKAEPLIDIGYLDQALQELESAARLMGPDDARMLRYFERRGYIFRLQRETAQAKSAYARAIKLAARLGLSGPDVAEADAGMGLCLMAEKNYDYALRFFKQGLRAGPALKTKLLIEEHIKKLEAQK